MRIALLPAAIGVALLAFGAFSSGFSGPARAQETVNVNMGDNWMCDPGFANAVCETTVGVGDTVIWTNVGALPHTATAAAFNSGIVNAGESYSFTFTSPGAHDYECVIHPGEMPGRITVVEAAGATPTPATSVPAPTPSPGEPTAAPGPAAPAPTPAAIPATGSEGSSGAVASWPAVLALVLGATLVLAGGGLAVRAVRRP